MPPRPPAARSPKPATAAAGTRALVPDSYLRKDEPDDPLEWELEQKWILNLSMHFRDKSEREKFFVTTPRPPTAGAA